jgi:hypothetical protein
LELFYRCAIGSVLYNERKLNRSAECLQDDDDDEEEEDDLGSIELSNAWKECLEVYRGHPTSSAGDFVLALSTRFVTTTMSDSLLPSLVEHSIAEERQF